MGILCTVKAKLVGTVFANWILKFEFMVFRLLFGMQVHPSIMKHAEYMDTSLLDIPALRRIKGLILT